MSLPAGGSKTVWLGVAGSDDGRGEAQGELAKLLSNPSRALAEKVASRQELAGMTQLSLPGDPLVENSIEWGKQNIADLTLQARDLEIRWTDQGKQFPAPSGTVNKATWIGAGYPDYPWIFGTDAEYTAFAAVSVGQFDAIKGHLRALREISDILNDRSGVVTHEVVADGSIWFGHDSRHTNPDGTTAYDFNTDETVKFPSTVALVWRWTGDRAFLNENYDFSVRNLRYVVEQLDEDGDGWPEGLGNVERIRDGSGEARQHRLLHPRPVRPGRHGAVQGRPGDLHAGRPTWRTHCATGSTTHGGTRRRSNTPTRWRRTTASRSRSTGSGRPRWSPS